jgi:hypothetical protein
MVYLPDKKYRDLFPEYKFPDNFDRDDVETEFPEGYGSTVQALNTIRDNEVEDYGQGMGVCVVQMLMDGTMKWWRVKRKEDRNVGIEEIIL